MIFDSDPLFEPAQVIHLLREFGSGKIQVTATPGFHRFAGIATLRFMDNRAWISMAVHGKVCRCSWFSHNTLDEETTSMIPQGVDVYSIGEMIAWASLARMLLLRACTMAFIDECHPDNFNFSMTSIFKIGMRDLEMHPGEGLDNTPIPTLPWSPGGTLTIGSVAAKRGAAAMKIFDDGSRRLGIVLLPAGSDPRIETKIAFDGVENASKAYFRALYRLNQG